MVLSMCKIFVCIILYFESKPVSCFIIPLIEKIRNEISLSQTSDIEDDCETGEQEWLSKILKTYNKYKLPNPKGVNVTIEIHIQDISTLDEFNSEFGVDMMFSVMWTDTRLAFKQKGNCKKSVTLEYDFFQNNLWSPNICISNTKSALVHSSPASNIFAILYDTGDVWTNYRMRARGPCELNFVEFPMDKQKCFLKFGSYSFNADEVKLIWLNDAPVTVMKNFSLSDFDFKNWSIAQSLEIYPNGQWSQLSTTFYFTRRFGFYFLQAYAPSYLTVIISWISFCIDYHSMPARTTIGISSLLAVTFQFGNVMKTLPKIGYVKALDIFMLGVTMFIFATLIELAIVCCLAKAYAKLSKQEEQSGLRDKPLFYERSGTQFVIQPLIENCMKTSFPLVFMDKEKMQNSPKKRRAPVTFYEPFDEIKSVLHRHYKLRNSKIPKCQIKPEVVDKVSLIVFPIAFIIFNAIYWTYYLKVIQDS